MFDLLNFSKLFHLIYASTKEYKVEHGSHRLKTRFRLETFCFIYSLVRTVMWTVEMTAPLLPPQDQCFKTVVEHLATHDYIIVIYRQTKSASPSLYDVLLALQGVFLVVFNYLSLKRLYQAGAPGNIALDKFFYYVVQNADQFTQCRRSKVEIKKSKERYYFKKLSLQHHHKKCNHFSTLISAFISFKLKAISTAFFYIQMGNFNLVKLKRGETTLNASYGAIPFSLRRALYWSLQVIDLSMVAWQLTVLASIVIVEINLIIKNWNFLISDNAFFNLLWVFVDFTMVAYQFMTLVQMGTLFVYFSFSMALMLVYKVRYSVRRFSESFQKVTSSVWLEREVWHFLGEHHRLSVDLLKGNQELWSSETALFLFTNSLPNVYLCTRLLLDQLTPVERLTFGLIFSGQTMATLIIFFPLATFPWALHHLMIKRILFDVQGQMKKGSRKCALLLCKLKVDDLFGRLLRGPKIGCTAGPLGVVTYHSVTEVN